MIAACSDVDTLLILYLYSTFCTNYLIYNPKFYKYDVDSCRRTFSPYSTFCMVSKHILASTNNPTFYCVYIHAYFQNFMNKCQEQLYNEDHIVEHSQNAQI